MDLEVVDGLAVPDELQGGERVKVVLVGEPLDRERFLESLAETGKVLFTAMRLGIDRRIELDVCRHEDDSEVEICGLHILGPGLSDSSSGFGVYGHFTELIHLGDGQVRANLRTAEPEEEGDLTYGFDLTFDLPVAP